MAIHKLETADAFVARDFEVDIPARGIVRQAGKILQGGAKELARSQTYQLALYEQKAGGASAGINATPESRADAVDAFVTELLPEVESGNLSLDAGKGVSPSELAALANADRRRSTSMDDIAGVNPVDHLRSVGVVAAAAHMQGLDGAAVAIDGLDQSGPALLRQLHLAGAKVVAVSTAQGSAMTDSGFDPATLEQALIEHGAGVVDQLGVESEPVYKLVGSTCDVLFAGSKMGVLDHKAAAFVKASVVVPTAPIPYTTKGALMLQAAGVRVVPDIVATAGPLLADLSSSDDAGEIDNEINDRVAATLSDLSSSDDGLLLAACAQAEEFLRSWRDELPFGRPFAP